MICRRSALMMMVLLLWLVVALAGCKKKSAKNESCARTDDCAGSLVCIDKTCVKKAVAAKKAPPRAKAKKKKPRAKPLPDVTCDPGSPWTIKTLVSLKTDRSELQTMAICLSRKHSPKWIAIKLSKRGMKWYRKKKYAKAASVFELSARIDPTYALAYWNRASVGGLLNDAPGTLLWLQKLRTLDTIKAFKYLRWLHKDKDFNSIREDPAMKAFIGTVNDLPMVAHRPGELQRLFPVGGTFNYLLTSGEPERKRKVVMTVASNRTINNARVVKLTIPLNDKWGLEAGPAYNISSVGHLVFSSKGVWLRWYGKMTAKDLAELQKEEPTWPYKLHKVVRPSKRSPDEKAYFYESSYRTEFSVCRGYSHHSPISGDSFGTAECYTPGKGLTYIDIGSVWGSYKLEMTKK